MANSLASWLSERISDAEKRSESAEGKLGSYWDGQLYALLLVEQYIANQENDIES